MILERNGQSIPKSIPLPGASNEQRHEFIKRPVEIQFSNMYEVQVLTERWVRYYNQIRPYGSLGGRPPAPQTIIPLTA